MTEHLAAEPDELAEIMAEVVGPAGSFGHRQHIHLAFIAARRHGPQPAADLLCQWIQRIARAHGAPGKYHATITIAWARVVAYHVAADPTVRDFDDFARRYPALLDKHLLDRHYSPAAIGSPAARSGWVEPDLALLPGVA